MGRIFSSIILSLVLVVYSIPAFSSDLSIEESSPATSAPATIETTIHGGTLVIAAYFILWVLFFFYIWKMVRRQSVQNKEFMALEEKLDNAIHSLAAQSK